MDPSEPLTSILINGNRKQAPQRAGENGIKRPAELWSAHTLSEGNIKPKTQLAKSAIFCQLRFFPPKICEFFPTKKLELHAVPFL